MPRTLPAIDAHQERLLARADASADAAERHVRRVWSRLLGAMRTGGPMPLVYRAALAALNQLPAVAGPVLEDLVRAHRDAATWTAEQLAETIPHRRRTRILKRRGLLEADGATTADLLISAILPPLDAEAVRRVVYGSGWFQTIQSLTRLAAPESLAAQIAGAVQAGQAVQQIAATIRPFVQGVQTSARRVARTAGLWVAHQAEADVYKGLENDVIAGYTVRAVLDGSTRPEHRARNGQQFWCRPTGGQKGLAEMPRPPREKDGTWAFNCLLPGTVVQGVFDTALKSRYSGEAFEIRTRGGCTLRVTANHPVCTDAGFLPARQLREGDRLIRYCSEIGRRLMGGVLHEQNPPARIEEIFRAAKKLRPSRVERGTAFDLHGDAQFGDGQIEVVPLNGELWHDPQAASDQQIGQFGFVTTDVRLAGGPRFGALRSNFGRVALAAPRLMGGGGLRDPFIRTHARPLDALRFGTAAQLDARREQDSAKPACGLTGITKVPATDAEFTRELLDGFPGLVSPDHVVEIREFNWTGHVYDLQSPGGWIVADGLFVSNCRCYLEPILSAEQ